MKIGDLVDAQPLGVETRNNTCRGIIVRWCGRGTMEVQALPEPGQTEEVRTTTCFKSGAQVIAMEGLAPELREHLKAVRRSVHRARQPEAYLQALRTLRLCRSKHVDVNSPDAIRAASIVGHAEALRIVSAPYRATDAMEKRVAGCAFNGRKR